MSHDEFDDADSKAETESRLSQQQRFDPMPLQSQIRLPERDYRYTPTQQQQMWKTHQKEEGYFKYFNTINRRKRLCGKEFKKSRISRRF